MLDVICNLMPDGLLAVSLLAAIVLLLVPLDARAQADYVVHNAAVYTANEDQPEVEAFAVRGERILMVGSNSTVLETYPSTRHIDAQGHAIIPGLIDAHAHLMGMGESGLQVDLVGAESIKEVVERLGAFASNLPEDAWITGRGWDQNEWPEQEFPTHEDLDSAFPDRPVYLTRVDGHASWANMAAMQKAGHERIREAEDPEGGRVVRNEDGQPTGVFIDAAMAFVGEYRPELDEEERRQALELALSETTRYGLTGVHDAGISRQDAELYREFIDDDNFDLRLFGMIGGVGESFDYFCERGPIWDYKGRLTVRSVKFYMDGALGSRGAALLEDYSDDTGNRGLLMRDPENYADDVRRAIACGFQVNTHAIGDRANRIVLDTYEQVFSELGVASGRHRIEHAQVVHPDDFARFADLGIIAAMQPIHATSDMGWAEERLGADRADGAYAWQRMLNAGVTLALGSDFPVEPVNPLNGFYAAVTRQDESGEPVGGWQSEQVLSRQEALRGFTIGAAFASFQEHELGSIEPGKKADFLLLSKNIMEIPVEEILETEVWGTFIDGRAVYGGW